MSLACAVVDRQCRGLTSPGTQGPNFFDRLSDGIFKAAVHTECTINDARIKFRQEHKILGPLLSIAAGFGSSILFRTLLEASNGIHLGTLFNIGGHPDVLLQQDIPDFSFCGGNGVTPSEDTTYSGLVEWLSQQTGNEPNSGGWNSNATQEAEWLNQLEAGLYDGIHAGDCIDLSTITINCADGVENCPSNGPELVNQLFGPNAVVVPEQPPLVTESPVEPLEQTPAPADEAPPPQQMTQTVMEQGPLVDVKEASLLNPLLKPCNGLDGVTTWWPNGISYQDIIKSLEQNMDRSILKNQELLAGVKALIAGDVNLQHIEPGECLQMDVHDFILQDGNTLKNDLEATYQETIQGLTNAVLTICAAGLGLVGLGGLILPGDKVNPNIAWGGVISGGKSEWFSVDPVKLGKLSLAALESLAKIALFIPMTLGRLVIKALFRKK